MNQTCKVCGEPAAGFHFGAFTCEGCKSFFGRSYNNLSSISECKNHGKCIIDKKNRTTCKACRLRKCYRVGMSKGGSRYGRRSNWFKIHCLLQEQQQQAVEAAGKATTHGFIGDLGSPPNAPSLVSHMSMLGYPGYLPEMMSNSEAFKNSFHSPFLQRHSDAALAAAAAADFHQRQQSSAATNPMQFFMMGSLPISPRSAFQLPPHMLFPGAGRPSGFHPTETYHPSEDVFKHRQSEDSLSDRCSSEARSEELISPTSSYTSRSQRSENLRESTPPPQVSPRQSPPETNKLMETQMPTEVRPPTPYSPMIPIDLPVPQTQTDKESIYSPEFSTSSSVTVIDNQEQNGPIDLSMKSHIIRASEPVPADCPSLISGVDSDIQSESSEEDLRSATSAPRRKFYNIVENDSDASLDANETAKRQKFDDPAAYNYNATGSSMSSTSLRGIFVCV